MLSVKVAQPPLYDPADETGFWQALVLEARDLQRERAERQAAWEAYNAWLTEHNRRTVAAIDFLAQVFRHWDQDPWAELEGEQQYHPAADNHGKMRGTPSGESPEDDSREHDNHGAGLSSRSRSGRAYPPGKSLASRDSEILDTMYGRHGGQQVGFVVPEDNELDYGLWAHRGLLTTEEEAWLDTEATAREVAEALGSSAPEIERLFSASKPTRAERARKEQLEDAFRAIQESGGHMTALSKALGWPVDPDGKCQKMARALGRARDRARARRPA